MENNNNENIQNNAQNNRQNHIQNNRLNSPASAFTVIRSTRMDRNGRRIVDRLIAIDNILISENRNTSLFNALLDANQELAQRVNSLIQDYDQSSIRNNCL